MAQQWADFEADADLYPNLRIVTAGDARVRDEHKALEGLTLPINHSFWKKHTPPFDWGCRCGLIQTDEPASEKVPNFKFKAEHQGNPFYDGKIFNKIPYANGFSKKDIQDIFKQANELFTQSAKYASNYSSYLKLKKNKKFADVKFNKKTGGLKATHKLHSFDPKLGHYEKVARDVLFNNGNSIILGKELADVGEKVIDGVKKIDGHFNGLSCDISSIIGDGKNAVKRALNHSKAKNADVAILYFPIKELFSSDRINKGIAMYKGQTEYRFKQIICIVEGKLYYYK